jgi:hypothetical protein
MQEGRRFSPTQNRCPASVFLAMVLGFLQILSYFLALDQPKNFLKALKSKGFRLVQQTLPKPLVST